MTYACAGNVHITEHGVTMCALEKVVDALSKKGRADRAIRAAQTMLEVCCDWVVIQMTECLLACSVTIHEGTT